MLLSILSGDLDLTCTYLDVVVFVGSLDVVILDVDESLFFWKNSRAPQTQYVHPPNGDPLWILDESWRIK